MNIETEFDDFFGFDTTDRQYVSFTSCKIFAKSMVHKAVEEYKAGLVPVASRSWNEYTAKFEFNVDGDDDAEPLYALGETK